MTNRAIIVALACGVLAGGSSAQGATFLWTPANASIRVETKAVRQTVSGVTARARGYTVEHTASTSKVFGPYSTGNGVGGLKIFGVDVRRLGFEQLGLISQPLSGIAVGGSDRCCGVVDPGFDSPSYKSGDRTIKKLDMAVFEFSQAVRVNSIKVDDVSNFDRDVWIAACSAAPNFAQGLVAAIAACTVRNKDDDASDGPFTHQVGLSGVSFLLVGARPVGQDLGRIHAHGKAGGGRNGVQFYIDSINFTK